MDLSQIVPWLNSLHGCSACIGAAVILVLSYLGKLPAVFTPKPADPQPADAGPAVGLLPGTPILSGLKLLIPVIAPLVLPYLMDWLRKKLPTGPASDPIPPAVSGK
jgi:hypothetical protein